MNEKQVSIKAVESVASQYGISPLIFKDWLKNVRGYQIIEEQQSTQIKERLQKYPKLTN
jgi:hypothetical protein